jgi:hypothetical protein
MVWRDVSRFSGLAKLRGALLAHPALIALALCLTTQASLAAARMDLFGVATGLTRPEVNALTQEKGWDCLTFNEEYQIVCPIKTGMLTIYLAPYLEGNPVYQIKYSLALAETREDLIATISAVYDTKPGSYSINEAVVWHLDDKIFIRLINSSRLELLNRTILKKEVEIEEAIIRREKRGE